MNITNIITEEFQQALKEIVTGAESRIPTYPYHDAGEGTFLIDVDEPQKNIHTKFQVTFTPTGNREEKIYSIAFKERGGDYNQKTGMGIQFRILATITKIIKEQIDKVDPNVITFSPVKESGESGNRRMSLYMQYVKGAAGDEYDAFILGDKQIMNVEKRDPSFPIENGYQEPQTIQDIVTQLSHYGGYYQTDLHPEDPDYAKFSIERWGGMGMQSRSEGRKTTGSCRRFVDWMFDYPDLVYVQGAHEPEPYYVPQPARDTEVPIQRVSGGHAAPAMMGTFQHFLQTEIYGNPEYDILEPFFETIKTPQDFSELRGRANAGLQTQTGASAERLRRIMTAIDELKRNYNEYARRHGSHEMTESEILAEVERNILELLK
jgi:hypothetical protein